ncbi:hypothetical protein HanIR_Chr08g0357721 [Helianthus annuus]|nr:hypothetical protein HanIR_Chr08g0357721 [Helianthus annuus]
MSMTKHITGGTNPNSPTSRTPPPPSTPHPCRIFSHHPRRIKVTPLIPTPTTSQSTTTPATESTTTPPPHLLPTSDHHHTLSHRSDSDLI